MSIDYSLPETNSQFGLLQVTTVWTILYCSSDALSLLERDIRYLYWRLWDLTSGLFTKLDFLLRLELKRDFVLIAILQFHCDIQEGLLQQIASKHVRLWAEWVVPTIYFHILGKVFQTFWGFKILNYEFVPMRSVGKLASVVDGSLIWLCLW